MAKKKKPAAPLYDWGDGKGKKHTIPKSVHAQNVEAKGYGIDLDAPVSQPLTTRQAYGIATAGADRQYGPQIQQSQTMERSVPEYFANYKADMARQQGAAQAYAQSVLAPAQTAMQAQPQLPPGLDANSPEAANAQQSAQAQQGMNTSSYSALGAIPVALNSYFAGAQTVADRDQPQAQAYYGQQTAGLKAQRGQAIAEGYGTTRTNEQNAQIAYGTLNVNRQRAVDTATAAAQAAKDKKAARVVSRKNTKDRTKSQQAKDDNKVITSGPYAGETNASVRAMSPAEKQKKQAAYDAATHPGTKPADQAKQHAAIQAATGKTKNAITDIIDYRQSDIGGETDDTTKPIKDVTGKPTGKYDPRKVTQADIDAEKVSKYGMLGRIAIAVRDGVPLTAEQVEYLHQRDKDFRVPSEWLPKGYHKSPAQNKDPHATGKKPSKAPGVYGHI
jgi:hypothetical protein